MSFCVHTLGVCNVVAALGFVGRHVARAQPHKAAGRGAHTRSYSRTLTATDGAADERSDDRAGNTAANRGVLLGSCRRLSTDRAIGVFTTCAVIATKLIEVLTTARKSCRTRTGGN
jgi:hypothetical protein